MSKFRVQMGDTVKLVKPAAMTTHSKLTVGDFIKLTESLDGNAGIIAWTGSERGFKRLKTVEYGSTPMLLHFEPTPDTYLLSTFRELVNRHHVEEDTQMMLCVNRDKATDRINFSISADRTNIRLDPIFNT